jgi:hypothetical protein
MKPHACRCLLYLNTGTKSSATIIGVALPLCQLNFQRDGGRGGVQGRCCSRACYTHSTVYSCVLYLAHTTASEVLHTDLFAHRSVCRTIEFGSGLIAKFRTALLQASSNANAKQWQLQCWVCRNTMNALVCSDTEVKCRHCYEVVHRLLRTWGHMLRKKVLKVLDILFKKSSTVRRNAPYSNTCQRFCQLWL